MLSLIVDRFFSPNVLHTLLEVCFGTIHFQVYGDRIVGAREGGNNESMEGRR